MLNRTWSIAGALSVCTVGLGGLGGTTGCAIGTGASIAVLDADPFPRGCPDRAGRASCVDPLRAPSEGSIGIALATPPAATHIALARLHRLTGELTIPPDGDVIRAPRAKLSPRRSSGSAWRPTVQSLTPRSSSRATCRSTTSRGRSAPRGHSFQ